MYISNHITHVSSVDITTTLNQELLNVIAFPSTWTYKTIKKIDIQVDKDCEILINNVDIVKIKNTFGLTLEYQDMSIKSLIVKTQGVVLYAIVGY